LRNTFNRQDLAELEGLLEVKLERMFAWQNELTGVNNELIAAQTRPERTQARVSANRAREQAVSGPCCASLRAGLRRPGRGGSGPKGRVCRKAMIC